MVIDMKCIKCGEEATKRYSPDMDLKGIGMCEKHEEEVMFDIIAALCDGWAEFEKKYT
jgi:hypothetical protein